jgi:DNA-binding NarL/FixJ family response regulator
MEGDMNLVIVEDSELVLYQLMRLVAKQPAICVAGVAASEEDAVALILATQPDAVLLDLSLSSGNGMSVLKRIREANSPARILVLTNNTNEAMHRMCRHLGIDGYYNKNREAHACLDQLYSWLPRQSGEAS